MALTQRFELNSQSCLLQHGALQTLDLLGQHVDDVQSQTPLYLRKLRQQPSPREIRKELKKQGAA